MYLHEADSGEGSGEDDEECNSLADGSMLNLVAVGEKSWNVKKFFKDWSDNDQEFGILEY